LKIINNMQEENIQDYTNLSTPENFNPFDEPVIKRDYTAPKVSFDPSTVQHIAEPTYQQPNLDELQDDDYEEEEKPKTKKPKKGFDSDDPFVNQELEEYSKKDADEASGQLVDTFLDGYKVAHTIGQRYFTLSEEEIMKKAIKGELNPDMRIPISPNQTISVREFISEFNNQVTEVLVVEDDFIEKVRPVMIRVFASRGYGMTDEQFLMFAFGKDIVQKGAQLYTFKKSLTQSLKMMTEMYNAQVQPEFNPNTPPPQGPQGPPPPQETPPPPPPPQETPPPPPQEELPQEIPVQEEVIQQEVDLSEILGNSEEPTMHDDMEDGITIVPKKRRRGRPKKQISLAPTEEEGKTIVIKEDDKPVTDIDLNQGFTMDDAKETEEK
tara:strand:+ start:5484 stop:6626 length:1143 start_codon:yes stop_codon:yes gene_type:complete